jgi:glycosyltransferase involved in cell wall biosynthesis
VDGALAVSRGLAQHIKETFSLEVPIEVAPSGVNLEDYAGERKERKKGKIIYTGQFYFWKGVENLIEAMCYLSEEELHLVGGDKKRVEDLRAKTKEMGLEGRIIFHGQVSPQEVKMHLADAAVAVLPLPRDDVLAARYTSPLKLFEYMAAGVPIVASDLPSVREVLMYEVNALLVEPENPQALAQAIRQAVNSDVSERLAKKASEDVLGYTWDRRAERIINFICSLKGG